MSKPEFYTDEHALKELSRSNPEAYRYLFDRYFSALCNFLVAYLHNRNISEEIALDIFTILWEKRAQIDIRQSLKGYLFTSAKNRAISHIRKEKREIFSQLEVNHPVIDQQPDSHNSLENQELHLIIRKAIDELPERSRMIYKMAWEEDLSYKAIAEKLAISPKTVENQMGIALKKLRQQLQPYYRQIFMLFLMSGKFFS